MKQSIQHEKLLFESFFFSNFVHLLIVDEDDEEDSESVLSFLRIVISFVNDVELVAIDERRSKFNETKQILS
jgi:hypothetical protein